jgi:hypothetical protein
VRAHPPHRRHVLRQARTEKPTHPGFALLAARPHASRGIWELAIFHKLAMTITALVYSAGGGIPDTGTTLLGDGLLTLVLVAAYISCRGWRT